MHSSGHCQICCCEKTRLEAKRPFKACSAPSPNALRCWDLIIRNQQGLRPGCTAVEQDTPIGDFLGSVCKHMGNTPQTSPPFPHLPKPEEPAAYPVRVRASPTHTYTPPRQLPQEDAHIIKLSDLHVVSRLQTDRHCGGFQVCGSVDHAALQ